MLVRDKIALVTGAASGIGCCIAEELLKNGVKTLISVDIHQSEPENVTKWRKEYNEVCIKYMTVDIGVVEHVKRCYQTVARDVGNLDIVVNCAGISDESNFKQVIDINLTGTVASTIEAIEVMRKDTGKGNGGIVVNVASIIGLCPVSYVPTYSATKHGLIAFTRAVAHNRDNLGIKFITICPGFTATGFGRYGSFFMEKPEVAMKKCLKLYKNQKPEAISSGLIKVMTEGKSGSVWEIDGGEWREERRLSEHRNWNSSLREHDNSLNETFELVECHTPLAEDETTDVTTSVVVSVPAVPSISGECTSSRVAVTAATVTADMSQKTRQKVTNLPTLSISGPSPPHEEFL
ncbi:hypothetical protein DMENIID0001_103430 [Sergentomyia squamirostris]